MTVTTGASAGSPCPSRQHVLVGVWDPRRLTVLNGCQPAAGIVEAISAEQDGDVHFDIAVDPSYRRLLSAGNFEAQHGWLWPS